MTYGSDLDTNHKFGEQFAEPHREQSDAKASIACSRRWGLRATLIGATTLACVFLAAQFRTPGQHHDGSVRYEARKLSPPFDLSNSLLPLGEILPGGPAKDMIPALTNPAMIAASRATYLKPLDRVIGIAEAGVAQAYPLRILNYHEIVNHQLAGTPIAVTYCPLCDSAAVLERTIAEGVKEFGVSGLLYNSNVLMYDRTSAGESLWSQLKYQAVSGRARGQSLRTRPCELTTWQDWLQRHPESTVLDEQTGHGRDYSSNPYRYYFDSPELMFPAKPANDLLPLKSRVLGIWSAADCLAIPLSAFGKHPAEVRVQLAGKNAIVKYSPASESLRVVEAAYGVEWVYSFWFAWVAMHPETEVFQFATQSPAQAVLE